MSITKSAGLVIIQNNKILLLHPTKAKWYGTYSFPKGHIENGETILDAAIRETKEESGIIISEIFINKHKEYCIDYKDKKGNVYKKVYYYIVYLEDDILPEIIDKKNLQLEEVDWGGFLNYDEANLRIFWRFKPILELIKNNKNNGVYSLKKGSWIKLP